MYTGFWRIADTVLIAHFPGLFFEYGRSLRGRDRIQTGNVPVVGSNGIDGYHSISLVKGHGIVIGRKVSVGKVNWYSTDFWPIDTTFYVQPKQEVNLRWVYYLLTNLHLDRLSIETGVPGLNRNDAYRLQVMLPTLVEQERIVAILDAADELRKLRQQADRLTGERTVVVDDLIATGGTLQAVCRLIERLGGEVVGISAVIDLSFLPWREKLAKYDVNYLISYDSE